MLVEFDNVSKVYEEGTTALEDISLSLDKGEFAFITGPSGAGKSTLLKMIYMDEFPTEGEVRVGKHRSTSISRKEIAMLRREVGVVFQEFRLLKELTAFENVVLPLRAVGRRESSIRKRVNSVLYSVGLSSKRHQFPLKLSGGEQQRIAIARAMALRPSILLADEPTGNLDQHTAEQVYDLILELNADIGTSLVMVTHDLSLAERMSRVLHMEDGKII